MDVRRLSLGQELHTALPVNLTSMDGDIGNREASSYKHQISKVLLHPLDNPALEELVLESFKLEGHLCRLQTFGKSCHQALPKKTSSPLRRESWQSTMLKKTSSQDELGSQVSHALV
jgi:hypothetical protein